MGSSHLAQVTMRWPRVVCFDVMNCTLVALGPHVAWPELSVGCTLSCELGMHP